MALIALSARPEQAKQPDPEEVEGVSNYLELVRGIEEKQGTPLETVSGAESAISALSSQGSGGANKPDETDERGLVIRWSEYPNWIELCDPLTGEWHEVKASECLPGVVAEADSHREEGGAA